jgi:hypothetical protein
METITIYQLLAPGFTFALVSESYALATITISGNTVTLKLLRSHHERMEDIELFTSSCVASVFTMAGLQIHEGKSTEQTVRDTFAAYYEVEFGDGEHAIFNTITLNT